MDKVTIREIWEEELPILEDLLYEAIYQPDKNNLIPRSILKEPRVNIYIENFGKDKNDHCLVAEFDGEIIGGVWVRLLAGNVKGYGNIDDHTPEFSISIHEEFRNCGIGTRLMRDMIDYLKSSGYSQTSLSVHKGNYAMKLYRKLGFEIIQENEEDYLMVLNLNK